MRAARPLILALAFALVSVAAPAQAGTVRGRIVRNTPQGSFPVAGIPVTVYRADLGRSGVSYSGPDGMFYLYNIPPGTYTLEVWVRPPMSWAINVYNQPFTDLFPIAVP